MDSKQLTTEYLTRAFDNREISEVVRMLREADEVQKYLWVQALKKENDDNPTHWTHEDNMEASRKFGFILILNPSRKSALVRSTNFGVSAAQIEDAIAKMAANGDYLCQKAIQCVARVRLKG